MGERRLFGSLELSCRPHGLCDGFHNMTTATVETKSSATDKQARRIEPISQPISILPTDSARLYTHIHPVLLLGSLYLSFGKLVNDPVNTLLWALLPLSLLQAAYCVTCLPASSGSSTQPTPSKTPKRKRVQFAKSPISSGSKIIVRHGPFGSFHLEDS